MLNDDGTTATPVVARDFVVYALPRRSARQRPNAKCQRGVRSGPYANRALSQAPKGPQWTPPVASTVSPRELFTFPQNPDQVGYPGLINMDGC